MLFVTWNVNSLRARLPRVLELLERHRPDVVALQETKCAPASFPEAELAAAGYQAIHHSAGQWAGVALLVRQALAVADPLLGLPGDPVPQEARWCEATVAGTRFISAYIPNGRALEHTEFTRKLAFLDAAAARVGELSAQSVGAATKAAPNHLLLAGDVNVAPTDDDVYDPAAYVGSTHVSAEERGALRAVMARGALVDAFRHVHQGERQFTWWDYRGGNFHKNLGMRIDLILLDAGLAAKLSACGIDRDFRKGHKPSDHAPLLARWEGITA